MPTGTKIVDWTNPANDQKLLLAIIKVSEISKKYGEIAAAFGENVPANCIALRIGKLRGKAKTRDTSKGRVKAQKNNLMTGLKPASTAKKTVTRSEDESRDDSSDNKVGGTVTPPKTPNGNINKIISGRITKRVSPRKTHAKNYKKMIDPFMDMEDAVEENGENVFGHPDKSSDEDSNPSDGDFGAEKPVKNEEEEGVD